LPHGLPFTRGFCGFRNLFELAFGRFRPKSRFSRNVAAAPADISPKSFQAGLGRSFKNREDDRSILILREGSYQWELAR
jgi:hypothetical protein